MFLFISHKYSHQGCKAAILDKNIDGRLSSNFSVLSYNEIVDETSDQAFGRLTTTLLSGGALDLETAVFLYGMGETGGECFPSSLLATGGSLKCT